MAPHAALGSYGDAMKRTGIKRKRAKPRQRGTACAGGKRCVAEYTWVHPVTDTRYRFCAKHYADALMGYAVKHEEMCCRFCGTQYDLEWAHVMSRRYLAVRWDRANSMALCRTHHYMFTTHPLKWEQWCRDVDIPWDELRVKALTGPPMQPVFVIERLRGDQHEPV